MPARRSLLALGLALSMIAVGSASVWAGGPTNPAPGSRMLVGFHELPRDEMEDGEWANRTVLEILDGIDVAVIRAGDPDGFRQTVRDRERVAFVERDRALEPTLVPNDPKFADQDAPPQIDLPDAWDHTLGDSSILAAVVDSGIRDDHEDLAGAVEAEKDFAEDDGVAQDECGHGTSVAGVLASRTDNGAGIAGTSNAGLLDAKVIQPHEDKGCLAFHSDIAQAIEWSTDQGADVISMSLGGPDASETLSRSIEYAADAGVVLVASAGNNGTCTDCVLFPARHPEVIAVACTDDAEDPCGSSSSGPEVELSAPGRGVLTTTADGGYGKAGGTSVSTPFVGGTVTLMLSVKPVLSRSTVRSILQDTAQDLGPDGHDTDTGYGEVHTEQAVVTAAEFNRPPTAAFTADCVSLTCVLDASASSDPDGDELTYSWWLGDGTQAGGRTVVHEYPDDGTYRVELDVSDGERSDAATGEVDVRLEVRLFAVPTEPVYGPGQSPGIEVTVQRADTGEGVPGVQIDGRTRWVPAGPLEGTPGGEFEGSLLASPLLAEPLRSSDVVYHEIGGVTASSGFVVLDVPSEAGSGVTAPTPAHRVHVEVTATVNEIDYAETTSYRVSAIGSTVS